MKREARVLHEKSVDSLFLAIEHFNRPTDRGRVEAVLILLDRAFELFLKGAILHRGGRIRDKHAKETIGFEKAVRKCMSEEPVKFLADEEALTVQMLNSLRDAAQHYILDLSEQHLYLHCQSGVTLYASLQERVFGIKLSDQLPARVLPVTTAPPKSLEALIEVEFAEVKALLRPGNRKSLQARAKLRGLAILEASLTGQRTQPTEGDLNHVIRGVRKGTTWSDIFPGIASLDLKTEGTGLNVSVHLVKKAGEAVQLVPEGTPGATVIAVRKVDKLGFYNLGLKSLAEKLNLSRYRVLALVRFLKIQETQDYYDEFVIDSQRFKRYSEKAVEFITAQIPNIDVNAIAKSHGTKQGKRKGTG